VIRAGELTCAGIKNEVAESTEAATVELGVKK
jgi:hypothetical protein